MSELLVRRALEKRLAATAGLPALVIFENDQRPPPDDQATPYVQCFLLPAQPDNTVHGAGVYSANGVFQASLKYQLGTGPADAATMAETIRSWFKRGTTLTEAGLNVNVTHTPAVARGYEDNGRWHVPVSIRWQAWVTVP